MGRPGSVTPSGLGTLPFVDLVGYCFIQRQLNPGSNGLRSKNTFITR